jgi:hypothetical protein
MEMHPKLAAILRNQRFAYLTGGREKTLGVTKLIGFAHL